MSGTILIDCALGENNETTLEMLEDLVGLLRTRGFQVISVPGSTIPKSTIGERCGPAGLELETALRETSFFWQEQSPQSTEIAKIQTKRFLLETNASLLLLWGSTSTRSVLLEDAAKHFGLPVLFLERGLIPDSWVVFEKSQWGRFFLQPKAGRHHRQGPFDRLAFERISRTRLFDSIQNSFGNSSSASTRSVLLLTGHVWGASKFPTEYRRLKANCLSLSQQAKHMGLTVWWKPHPQATNLDFEDFKFRQWIPESPAPVDLIIADQTTLWTLGAFLEIPVIPTNSPSYLISGKYPQGRKSPSSKNFLSTVIRLKPRASLAASLTKSLRHHYFLNSEETGFLRVNDFVEQVVNWVKMKTRI